MESLLLALELDDHDWLVIVTSLNLEWPELDILLDDWVGKLPTDESLDIEDGVGGVSGSLVLGSLTDLPLLFGETDIGGSGSVTLLVLNDDDFLALHDGDTGVGGTEIDTDTWP